MQGRSQDFREGVSSTSIIVKIRKYNETNEVNHSTNRKNVKGQVFSTLKPY